MSKKTYDDVRKNPKPKSIWDEDVDYEKVMKLSPSERHRLFPNDFNGAGEAYGDF
jgi:hypothetical protein